MKLLVDMNLSPRWTRVLTDAGFEAVHWSTVGPADAPDPVIMDYAASHGFTVLTHDLDFGAMLAATNGEKPSVVQIRSANVTPEHVGGNVLAALVQMVSELEAGALLTVDVHRTRLRLLPLRIRRQD